jgi:hypothetical protein
MTGEILFAITMLLEAYLIFFGVPTVFTVLTVVSLVKYRKCKKNGLEQWKTWKKRMIIFLVIGAVTLTASLALVLLVLGSVAYM